MLTSSFVGSPEYMSPEILAGESYNFSVDYYTLGVLFYEMLVGLPPHYSENKIQMYKDIRTKPARIPSILGQTVKDLLEGLLRADPSERLGCNEGISEIKKHPFFSDIDWTKLENKQPQSFTKRQPIEVEILVSNFDERYTGIPVDIDQKVEGAWMQPQTNKRKQSLSVAMLPSTLKQRLQTVQSEGHRSGSSEEEFFTNVDKLQKRHKTEYKPPVQEDQPAQEVSSYSSSQLRSKQSSLLQQLSSAQGVDDVVGQMTLEEKSKMESFNFRSALEQRKNSKLDTNKMRKTLI
jgi:serine/threonine protein kinase